MDTHNLFTLRVTPTAIQSNTLIAHALPPYLHLLMIALGKKDIFFNTELPYIYTMECTNKYLEPVAPHMHFIFFSTSTRVNLRLKIRRTLEKLGSPVRGTKDYCLQEIISPDDIHSIFRYCMKSGPFKYGSLELIPGFNVDEQALLARTTRKENAKYHKTKREQLLLKQSCYDRLEQHLLTLDLANNTMVPILHHVAQWYLEHTNGLNFHNIQNVTNKFMVKNGFISLNEWIKSNRK